MESVENTWEYRAIEHWQMWFQHNNQKKVGKIILPCTSPTSTSQAGAGSASKYKSVHQGGHNRWASLPPRRPPRPFPQTNTNEMGGETETQRHKHKILEGIVHLSFSTASPFCREKMKNEFEPRHTGIQHFYVSFNQSVTFSSNIVKLSPVALCFTASTLSRIFAPSVILLLGTMILVMPVLSQNNAVFLQVPTGLNPSQSQNKMLVLLCQVSFPFDSALSHSQHSLTRSFRKRLKRSCGVKLYNTQPSYCLLHMNNYYTSLQCPFNIFQSLTSFSVGSQTRSWWLFLCETSTASWRCGDSTEMRSFRWSKGKLQHFSLFLYFEMLSSCWMAANVHL